MKKTNNKTTKKIRTFFSILSLAIVAFMISCEIPSDPSEIIELRIKTDIFNHKGFITIKDLADQTNLEGSALKATVTIEGYEGDIGDILVTEGGKKTDTWTIKDGLAGFAVNPNHSFTEPINFKLQIFGDNYLTKTISLTISPLDFITEVRATVLNIKDVPSGVGVADETETLSSGSNASGISVTTEVSTNDTSAEVVIPSDNVFRDENGADISSGDLTVQVVYFDGNDEEAIRSSINGNVASIIDENGDELTNVTITPIATADINMTVGSSEVKGFEKYINISMDINADSNVQAGDVLSIFSTSDDENWEFETTAIVTVKESKLVLDFQTIHLSTFSAGFILNLCSEKTSTIFIGDGDHYNSSYEGEFKLSNGTIQPTTAVKFKMDDGTYALRFDNVPFEPATLTIGDYTSPELSWCGEIVVDLSDIQQTGGTTVHLTLSAKCTGNSAIIPDNVKLYIDYDGSSTYTEVGIIREGKISIHNVELNNEYSLKVVYDGNSGYGTYTFNEEQMEILNYPIPGDICDELGL
tara:strand:- start:3177 stop:4760 length:1584 start_codon:yes stop_codon:yes gene_type:complete